MGNFTCSKVKGSSIQTPETDYRDSIMKQQCAIDNSMWRILDGHDSESELGSSSCVHSFLGSNNTEKFQIHECIIKEIRLSFAKSSLT